MVVTQEAANPVFERRAALGRIYGRNENANSKWNAYLDTQVAWFRQIPRRCDLAAPLRGDQLQVHSFWQRCHSGGSAAVAVHARLLPPRMAWPCPVDARPHAWISATAARRRSTGSNYCPGSAYVDIVSLDSYPPDAGPWVTAMYSSRDDWQADLLCRGRQQLQ